MIIPKIKRVMIGANGQILKTPKLPNDLPTKVAKPTLITLEDLLPAGRVKRSKKETAANGHWQFDERLDPKKYFGFIYLIEDTVNSRMYIGKKQYLGAGAQNKGIETNWKSYTSSCKALQAAIQANEKSDFNFYVLDQYKIRGSLGYAETWSLMYVRAPANRNVWYNMLVNKISWSVKEDVSKKHEDRLRLIVSGFKTSLTIWNE